MVYIVDVSFPFFRARENVAPYSSPPKRILCTGVGINRNHPIQSQPLPPPPRALVKLAFPRSLVSRTPKGRQGRVLSLWSRSIIVVEESVSIMSQATDAAIGTFDRRRMLIRPRRRMTTYLLDCFLDAPLGRISHSPPPPSFCPHQFCNDSSRRYDGRCLLHLPKRDPHLP